MITSNSSFAARPIAAAAGSQARVDEPELVHGAAPKENSITLEEAERVIRETAEKLWRGSKAAVQSLIDMLVNFFRWITRPFREAISPNANVPTAGTPQSESALDVNNVMSPPSGPGNPGDAGAPGAPGATAKASIPDDHLGESFDTAESSDAGGASPVAVPKLAFRKSFTGSKPTGTLPVGADTVRSVVEEVAEKHPDAEAADPLEMSNTATLRLLEVFVSKVTQVNAQVRALEAQINTHLVALAALGDTPAEQLLSQVLASNELGGLQGDEIRRLHAERFAQEQKAADFQGQIENVLLNLKQQGVNVADIASHAKVADALPDWPARLERIAAPEPAAPTPAERRAMALEVDPDVEIASDGPSPERVARLKAALISNTSTDDDDNEKERPRG